MIKYIFLVFSFIIFLAYAFFYKEVLFLIIALFIGYRLFTYHKLLLVVVVVFSMVYLAYFNFAQQANTITNLRFKVVKVNRYNYWLANEQGKILLKTSKKLNMDDEISLSKKLKRVESLDNFHLFNYSIYLLSNKIHFEVYDDNFRVIKKNEITHKVDKINTYFNYLFLMDKKDFDDEVYKTLVDLAIIHLVVIAGYHFNIIKNILKRFLFFISSDVIRGIIIVVLLGFYLVQLDFSYPASRAFLLVAFSGILRKYEISSLNQLSIVGLLIILINPLALLSMSFIFTFFVSFIIILLPKYLKKNKLLFSLAIYLTTIPLVCSINYQISILGFIFSIILLPFVLLLYPMVLISNFFNILESTTLNYINIFEKLLKQINEYNYFFKLGSWPLYLSIIYLVLLFTVFYQFERRKHVILLPFCFLYIFHYLPSFNGYVTFLNVGQGDCIIIKPPFSKEVMMIDVAKPYKQNTVNSIIIPYLKATKVEKVNTLVITHDDIDHSGGKEDLVNNFSVERVIEKKQKIIKFNEYTFIDLLYDENFKDKNANSITLYSRINGLNYFFTGDMSVESEQVLLTKINKLPIDILKVAHHGSKTSSSLPFLLKVNPSIGIYMSKKNNHYKHPHQVIKERFDKLAIKTYNTADNGTVVVYFNKYVNYIKTYY